jgi:hypothetical protein
MNPPKARVETLSGSPSQPVDLPWRNMCERRDSSLAATLALVTDDLEDAFGISAAVVPTSPEHVRRN